MVISRILKRGYLVIYAANYILINLKENIGYYNKYCHFAITKLDKNSTTQIKLKFAYNNEN